MKNQDDKRFYVLVGAKENWQVSVEKKLWGFTENSKGMWNKTKVGEYLAFYVTSPIKKIIGFGKIKNKFIDESLVWNDEKTFKRSLWKYKLLFDVIYVCDNWEKNGIDLGNIRLGVSRKVISKLTFLDLVETADSKWNTQIDKQII